jgi:hypothetical protein
MNLQQVGQPKSSNGYGRRKSDKDGASKSDNKIAPGKSNAGRLASTGEHLTRVVKYFLFHLLFR